MATGYDIGASLAASSSSGANTGSGAQDLGGSSNFGGTTYGPGSVVRIQGAVAAGAINPLVIIAALVLAVLWFTSKRKRR